MTTPAYFLKRLSLMLIAFLSVTAHGQQADPIISERIAVVARPATDSITLRWAPLNFRAWRSAQQKGYRIERYVLARDGAILPEPEKAILHAALAPSTLEMWKEFVEHDRYAAIAAQALFGERFEIDLTASDAFRIVDQVRENEQRFAFALFSADMSPRVARLSGLWFSDTTVKKNEKYLYRIVINTMDSLRGSTYIAPTDAYTLLPPQNFRADFQEQLVSLRWDKSTTLHYTAFIVERSHDGHTFERLSDMPVSTVSPASASDTRYNYALDSLGDFSKTFYYRVRGLTPFGETGPASQIVSGRAQPSVGQVPYISSVDDDGNTSLTVRWEFPESDSHAIKGFRVSRATHPKENFSELTPSLLSPEVRTFRDELPNQVNYYRVTAIGLNDTVYPSALYFAQLIDSVPPSAPSELQATVDTTGVVSLSWQSNLESDLYGYRVYKSWHKSEELAQITAEPCRLNFYHDSLNLISLNETVYYSVMAVDNNQNHSPLSTLLRVTLPDRVPPQPPVLRRVTGSREGIRVAWTPGSSEDIVKYLLFRKSGDEEKWTEIKVFGNLTEDADCQHLDTGAPGGTISYYTLVAVDDAGLESDPAHPIGASRPEHTLRAAVRWKKPTIVQDESKIILKWEYHHEAIKTFRLFRSVDHRHHVLVKTLAGNTAEFTDTMIPGQHYSYRILALFRDGRTSSLSDELEYQY